MLRSLTIGYDPKDSGGLVKLQQLRFLCEIANQGFSFAKAAESLYTSQPGISKQIRQLEKELGIDIFVRRKGRVVEVTEPGGEIIDLARNVLREAQRVKSAATEFLSDGTGQLTIAATYVLARYALPPVYHRFVHRYPRVHLKLLQGSPEHVSMMAASGEVDLGVTTRHTHSAFDGVLIDYCELPRVLVVPKKHPLLRNRSITLKDIAEYPLIRLGRYRMHEVFKKARLTPKAIFDDLAVDIDVVKALVETGLGVAILPAISYNAKRDINLRAVPVGHLFEPHICCIAVRRNHYLRGYMYAFIRLLAPQLDQDVFGMRSPGPDCGRRER